MEEGAAPQDTGHISILYLSRPRGNVTTTTTLARTTTYEGCHGVDNNYAFLC